jgi:hypothetical protein
LPPPPLWRLPLLLLVDELRELDELLAGRDSADCRLPWLMLPARRASSEVNSWAVPFAWAALPPWLAISRWRCGSIDANPRLRVPLL